MIMRRWSESHTFDFIIKVWHLLWNVVFDFIFRLLWREPNTRKCTNTYIVIYTGTLAQRLECSPMARETWVQSQVESYQRL